MWASIPATTMYRLVSSVRQKSQFRHSASAEPQLGRAIRIRSASGATVGPSPCGYCSVAETGIPRSSAARTSFSEFLRTTSCRTMGEQLLLHVHDQEPGIVTGEEVGVSAVHGV